ncbi:hypothetical protein J437_LFUL014878 [Ladona fulva]|uniref:Zinc carboxypeptidase A 1 n=1 Tax=Ladona fulva TaxID=123851 RepID=A0A8K0KL50_LADFU|nr:hypothetical protein J437_LFUL014878 [Ladona fulva]
MRNMFKSLVLLAILATTLALPAQNIETVKARYDNYKVYRVIPTTKEQIKKLYEIEESGVGISFWRDPTHAGRPADILVPPHLIPQAHNVMNSLGLEYEIIIQDVQKLIDEVHPKTRQASGGMDWNDYHRLDEIYAWLDDLAAQNPDRVSIVIGGSTYEGRDIKGVKYTAGGQNKPIIFMDAGIHAREWISPAVQTYILNQVINSQDPSLRELVDAFDWYFFPVINPDGYEYSHESDRMWRKTRGPGNLFCKGTDANRNWGFQWSSAGASDNPCSETYHGSGPFSETETKTLSDFISTMGNDLVMYISLHSFSQLILFPYGYTDEHLPDYDNMLTVGNRAADALATRYGTQFVCGNIVETLYVASGSNLDWVKGNFNTPLTYVFELRDQGNYGFILPPDQIIPSGEEMVDAMMSLLKDAKTYRRI